MIRKLLLPALALLLLGGCASTYGYRDAPRGDYYYGHPTTQYRYHGSIGYGHGYGYLPYGYHHGWLGYGPRYPYYYRGYPGYRPPVVVHPRPGQDRPRNDRRPPPWRDLDRIRQEHGPVVQRRPASTLPRPAVQRPAAPARPAPSANRASRMNDAANRARSGERVRSIEP